MPAEATIYTVTMRKAIALLFGLVCQICFSLAVYYMAFGLHGEMRGGDLVSQSSALRVTWNLFLLFQFPILHSAFLSAWGRKLLTHLAPYGLGRQLVSTTFVTLASMQLVALFALWSHIDTTSWEAHGELASIWEGIYACSWIMLAISMVHAGLGIQMGLLGWTSLLRDKPVSYPSFSQRGLYRICRHPVYLSMALVSCTGPVWNWDHAMIASVFLTYCILGPIHKERRLTKYYGEAFSSYAERTPFFPTPRSIVRAFTRA